MGISEGTVQPVPGLLGMRGDLRIWDGKIVQLHQILVQPLAVGLAGGVVFLDLVIVQHLPLLRIDQEHPAGTQTVLLHDMGLVQIQHAHFGSQDQPVVVHEIVPGGPQTVAVQHRPHLLPVGEEDSRRAVPGFHHGGIVPVEIPLLHAEGLIVLPGLRDADHHGQRKIHAVHHQKLDGVVQHGGIRSFRIHHGKDPVHVPPQCGRGHGLLTGQHAVHVAADGIDLSVVEDEAVGVCPFPAGGGIGGEAGMHHGNGGSVLFRLQIRIEPAQLSHQEQSLVHDGTAGHAHHIGVVVGLLKLTAGHVQFPVKGQSRGSVCRSADKALLDHRHARQCRRSQDLRADGHITPSQKGHPLFLQDDFQHLSGLSSLQGIRGEKEHAHGVVSGLAQIQPLCACRVPEEFMADLQQNPHAVAGLSQGILAGTVLQTLHDLQGVVHGLMGLFPVDVHHGTDAAGIPLIDGAVSQPLFLRHHGFIPRFPDVLPSRKNWRRGCSIFFP